MATAVRFCAICRKIFPVKGSRKTCSDPCQTELLRRREQATAIVKPVVQPPEKPLKVKQPAVQPIRHTPTPEEIRLKCSLMRSGLLVIASDGTPIEIDPAR